jgi:integrase
MAKPIEQLVVEANQRLKAGRTGLVIELRKNSLCLRGTLPPKPDSDRPEAHQQRIPTGYLANPAGIQRAEADARAISAQLIRKEFVWTNHVEIFTTETATTAEVIERLSVDYLAKYSVTSWKTYLTIAYKWLPQHEPLSAKAIIKVLDKYPQSSSSREKAYNGMSVLIKYAKLNIDITNYKSTYARASLNPKDIPSDQEIVFWHGKILNPQWQYAYGVFATYGLRNHELFFIEWDLPNIRVTEGKTGARIIYPLHPEWVDRFNLANAVLPTTGRATHKSQGEAVCKYFARQKLPFSIYCLRHAWAIRNIGYGISDTVAAACMGHSVDVHTQTYQRWMSERDIAAVVSRAIANPNRPLAPV